MEKVTELFAEATEQLDQLKNELLKQKRTSERLESLANALKAVSEHAALVPARLQALVDQAAGAERHMEAAVQKIGRVEETIPSIVARLEQSDFGQSITVLTATIAQAGGELVRISEGVGVLEAAARAVSAAAESAVGTIAGNVQELVKLQKTIAVEVSELREHTTSRLKGLSESVQILSSRTESIATGSVNAFAQVTQALRASFDRDTEFFQKVLAALHDLRESELASKEQIAQLTEKLDVQAKTLASVAARKGFLFG